MKLSDKQVQEWGERFFPHMTKDFQVRAVFVVLARFAARKMNAKTK